MWKLLKAYIGIAIMYKYFNPNPCGKNVSDCTVRAICKATGKDWGEVYLRLCMRGAYDRDMSNTRRGTHYVRAHYSRDGGIDNMKRQLQEMLDNADDESIRRAIQRCMDTIED